MALINCKECGKELSDSAEFCPHCGYRLVWIDWGEEIERNV